MLTKNAASTGNWKQSAMKESGIKTRAYLKALNK
jgi:endoglucanase